MTAKSSVSMQRRDEVEQDMDGDPKGEAGVGIRDVVAREMRNPGSGEEARRE